MAERPFSQGSTTPLVVAHRGDSKRKPENTIEAFDGAIEAGADAVEFDVRLSADGVPVVLHDEDLARTTDTTGPVHALSLEEIRRVRIPTPRGWTNVPTLREVLDALSGRVAVDVELKNVPGEADFEPGAGRLVDAIASVFDDLGFVGDVLASSFDPIALEAVHRRMPSVATGILTMPDVDAGAALSFARERGHAWILPAVRAVRQAGPGFIEAAASAGLRVGTWISDDPAEVVQLFREGVAAVATNDPGPVAAAVREAFAS